MNKLTNITTFPAAPTVASAALAFTVAATALLLCSCKEKGEVQHFRTPKTTKELQPSPASPAQTSQSVKTARYTWTLPAGWSDKPASGMRLATIIIPSDGKTLDASVTEFGGTLAGNINRWRGQIGLPPLEESAIPATLKEINTGIGKGYIATLTNPATPDKALLAAIIPRPSDTSVFVKLPCSSAELGKITPAFTAFAESITANQE